MPDKYVPNSSVMGGGAPRKIAFFGRDKIGDDKPAAPAPETAHEPSQSTGTERAEIVNSPAPGSPAADSPPYGRPRAVDGVHPERGAAADSSGAGSPAPGSPTINLWSSLPQVDGHLRLPNIIVDHLYQFLDLQERSVYEQLYRLSHGYGKSTCTIGYPKLAVRSGMGRTATIQTVERLIRKGLISRIGKDVGGRKEQGSTYWVSSPGSSAPGSPAADSSAPEPNKVNALKETNKRGGSHQRRDYASCPDCRGTGFSYPNGFEKGVAKCPHPSLQKR